MEHLRRLKKVINWLIFKEIAENERALAETLGYTKSSLKSMPAGKRMQALPLPYSGCREKCFQNT